MTRLPRYLDTPEQKAYEAGWRQMHEAASAGLLASDLEGEQLAAALEGAAAALDELADRQREVAALADREIA